MTSAGTDRLEAIKARLADAGKPPNPGIPIAYMTLFLADVPWLLDQHAQDSDRILALEATVDALIGGKADAEASFQGLEAENRRLRALLGETVEQQ